MDLAALLSGLSLPDVPALFTDTAAWSVIIGVVSPWVIAFVQQPHWSVRTRKIVAVVAAVVLGTLTSLGTGAFFADGAPVSVLGAVGIVLVASQTSYRNLAQPATGRMRTETATSPKKRRRKRKPPAPAPAPPAEPEPEPATPEPAEDDDPYGGNWHPDAVTVEEILRRNTPPATR